MTTPTEFVLWLNGAAGVMGDAPTPEQWVVIKEKMGESLGFLAAKKLLERAEEQVVHDRKVDLKRAAAIEQMNRHVQFNHDIAKHQALISRFVADSARQQPGLVVPIDPPEKPLSFLGATISRLKGAA